jgi:hypothetical protein
MERFRTNYQEYRLSLTENVKKARQKLLVASMPALLAMNNSLAEGVENNTDVVMGAFIGAVAGSSLGFIVSRIKDKDDFEANSGEPLETSRVDTVYGMTALSFPGALVGASVVIAYKSVFK